MLVVIFFELMGSLDYVLLFLLVILVVKWVVDVIELLSIYDLLIEMNFYFFFNNKYKFVFMLELVDIVLRVRKERIIDISISFVVLVMSLRMKLELLYWVGELDGGLLIVRYGILVGLILVLDLEYVLDNL